jgi:PRTRC genetic system ThiF family protein
MRPNKFIAPESLFDMPEILLIGCGGTGSEMLDSLYRIHCCLTELGGNGLKVTVMDGDIVEPHNIGRQRFWGSDVGYNKAVCAVSRYNAHGGTEWEAIPYHADSNLDEYSPDVLITAVDNGQFRYDVGQYLEQCSSDSELIWIDGGVSGNEGQVILGEAGGLELGPDEEGTNKLPNVYDLFGEYLLAEANDTDTGCASLEKSLASQGLYINRLCADIMGEMLYSLLRTGSIEHHGSFFSTTPYQAAPLAISMDNWKTFPAISQRLL